MEIEAIIPQAGKQEMFLSSPADVAIYGGGAGSGKTFALLMEAFRNVNVPGYGAVIFRRSTPEITAQGGLWDEASSLYPFLGGKPVRSRPMRYYFPQYDTKITFTHLQSEDTLLSWHGAQIPFIGFDELQLFTEKQFWYMLSRNRSTCGVAPYVRATCNADSDSFLAGLLEWYIDQETGFAIEERAGVIRWVCRKSDGSLAWADSEEEIKKDNPNALAKSFTFIPAKVEDNLVLLEKDPGYLANLDLQQLVDRERLRNANWKIKHIAGTMFKAGWFEIVDVKIPRHIRRFRYWDKAGTEGAGDWTAGALLVEYKGIFYWEDFVIVQASPMKRNRIIKNTALQDKERFDEVEVWVEQEPAASGKESAAISLMELRTIVDYVNAETVSGNKITRAKMHSAQAEQGTVKLIRGPWNETFLRLHEAFPTKGIPDDVVDAASGAFNKCRLHTPTVITG